MSQIRGIINVAQIGLSDSYLTFDDEHKYQFCKNLIETSLRKMTANATMEEKKSYFIDLIDRSIKTYEELDEFESCMVLMDLKEVLHQI
jgi:hypothetical protein